MKSCSVLAPRTCGCPQHEALDGDVCVKCSERNLECDTEGSDVLHAKPEAGFFRLWNQTRAVQCFEPEDRCTPDTLEHKMLKQ